MEDEDLLLFGAAAYNSRPLTINKAIEQTGKEKPSIDEVLKQKAIPGETRDYIKKIRGR